MVVSQISTYNETIADVGRAGCDRTVRINKTGSLGLYVWAGGPGGSSGVLSSAHVSENQ